jgi:hypothetical protein
VCLFGLKLLFVFVSCFRKARNWRSTRMAQHIDSEILRCEACPKHWRHWSSALCSFGRFTLNFAVHGKSKSNEIVEVVQSFAFKFTSFSSFSFHKFRLQRNLTAALSAASSM